MRFEDLKVWSLWRELYNDISNIFDEKFRDYFFKDQILRASLSIINNIAEWFERETQKELTRFLYISKWSCWELRSMLYIAKDKNYIDYEKFESLIKKSNHICIMLYKFIQQSSKNI